MTAPTSLPQFSLLIPFYWGDDPVLLLRALNSSTIDQSVKPSEVVLVQDGPIDEPLRHVVEQFSENFGGRVNHVVIDENQGLANALRVGLAACHYDVVARMDADDISLAHRFERQLPLIAQGFELVGSAMLEYEHDPNAPVGERVPPESQAEIYRHVTYHNPFNHPTMVYRKSAILRAGGYEPFGPTEDYWLVARCIAAGLRMRNVLEPLLLYRVSTSMYGRRGGWSMYSYEMKLQRFLLKNHLTSLPRFLFNVIAKFVFRLAPSKLRRLVTRRAFSLQNRTMRRQSRVRES